MNKLWLLASILLSGCVGVYQQPSTSQPHAVLISEFAGNDLIQGGAQFFYAYDNENCQANYGAAVAALKDTERSKTTRIPSNNIIYIQAATSGITEKLYACSTGFCLQAGKCTSLISFTPQQGETYIIKHNYKNEACSISLISKITNEIPKSIKTHSIKNSCKI